MRIRFLGAAGDVTGSLPRDDAAGEALLVDLRHVPGRPRQPEKEPAQGNFEGGRLSRSVLTHAISTTWAA
jgi:hypothetical protein